MPEPATAAPSVVVRTLLFLLGAVLGIAGAAFGFWATLHLAEYGDAADRGMQLLWHIAT
jgi:hypothetical protein